MGRSPCCDKSGVKKGPWTPEEDQKLLHYIRLHGPCNWRSLPSNAGLQRCGKSCRLRWTNYLRPDIKRGRFSFEEEETIIQLHSVFGNKWRAIAARLPGRTDNEIKNYWNNHIRKRLLRSGIDLVTLGPRLDLLHLSFLINAILCNLPNLLETQLAAQLSPDILRLSSILSPQQNPQCPDNATLFHNLHQNIVQVQLLPPHDEHQDDPTTSSSRTKNNLNNESSAAEATTSSNPCYMPHSSSLPPLSDGFDLDSLMSTPMSPFGSSSLLLNSGSTGDEPESNHSSLFKFEIPESFAVDDFIM